MTRVFACIGFSWLVALVAAVFIGKTPSFVAAAVLILIFVGLVVYAKHNGRKLKSYQILSAALISASLAFAFFGVSFENKAEKLSYLDGEEAAISARLVDFPQKEYGKYCYELEVDEVTINGEKQELKPFKTRMSSSMPVFVELYDYLYADVVFYSYKDGGFSTQSRYLSREIQIGSYLKLFSEKRVKSGSKPLDYYLKLYRNDIQKRVKVAMPKDEASIVNAIILGDRSNMSAEIAENFRKLGISHLLVVSGFHVSAVVGFIMMLLGSTKLKRRSKNLLAMLVVFLFMMISGFQSSVMRAGMMNIIFLLADMWGYEADKLNSLGFAVLVMCLFNPFLGGDIGFLMSVITSLALILFGQRAKQLLLRPFAGLPRAKKIATSFASAISASLVASIALLPFQAYLFGTLPILAPLMSTLFMPLVAVMIYVGIVALLFLSAGFLAPIAQPFLFIKTLLSRFLLWTTSGLARTKGLYVGIGSSFGLLIIACLMLILAVTIIIKPDKFMKRMLAVSCVLIVALGVGLKQLKYKDVVTIAVANMNEESCVLLMKNREGAAINLGGYDEKAASRILTENNIREVESILLLEGSQRELAQAKSIVQGFAPKLIYLSEDVYLDRGFSSGGARQRLSTENKVDVLSDEEATVLDKSVELEIYGNKIIVERNDGLDRVCDILITNNPKTSTISAFTVLQTDDIIEAKQFEGAYITHGESRVTYIDVFANGSIEIRRES